MKKLFVLYVSCHILVWMYERISSVSCSDIVAEYMAGLLLEHDKDIHHHVVIKNRYANIEDTNPFEMKFQTYRAFNG